MAFVTGVLLIDAPASALNNLGNVPGRLFDNVAGVKVIRTREGAYPYVSAQAFRYAADYLGTGRIRVEGGTYLARSESCLYGW